MSVDWGEVLKPQIDGQRDAVEGLARTLHAVVTDLKLARVELSPGVIAWHKQTGEAIRRADEWTSANPIHGQISAKEP